MCPKARSRPRLSTRPTAGPWAATSSLQESPLLPLRYCSANSPNCLPCPGVFVSPYVRGALTCCSLLNNPISTAPDSCTQDARLFLARHGKCQRSRSSNCRQVPPQPYSRLHIPSLYLTSFIGTALGWMLLTSHGISPRLHPTTPHLHTAAGRRQRHLASA